jgi:hypothetical protein
MKKATMVALGLLLAGGLTGCAGNGDRDPSVAVADGGTGALASASVDPVQYSKCMRENGMDWFPTVVSADTKVDIPDGVDKEKLDAALSKCREYGTGAGSGQAPPVNAANQEKQLQYSKCMRENGLPDFPDPPADGSGISLGKAGVDKDSATFKAAQAKCQDLLPGSD